MLTLRATPTTLTDEERTPHRPRVRLPRLHIHKPLLRLHHTALPLVVYTQHLGPDLKVAPMRCDGQGLQELDLALAIEHAAIVELGNTRNGGRGAGLVEIDDLLGIALEGQDDRVRGEGDEVGMQLVQEVELVGGGADAVGEEEDIALEPGDSDLLFIIHVGIHSQLIVAWI